MDLRTQGRINVYKDRIPGFQALVWFLQSQYNQHEVQIGFSLGIVELTLSQLQFSSLDS